MIAHSNKYFNLGLDSALKLGWNINCTPNKDIKDLGDAVAEALNYYFTYEEQCVPVMGNFMCKATHAYIRLGGSNYLYSDGLYIENGELTYYATTHRNQTEEEFLNDLDSRIDLF